MPKRTTQRMIEQYPDQDWAYEQFHPKGALHIVCPQCRVIIPVCENIATEDRARIRDLVRSGKTVEAIKAIREETGFDLGTAKAIKFHIRTDPVRCHHCDAPASRGSLLCGTCMSVNLDW